MRHTTSFFIHTLSLMMILWALSSPVALSAQSAMSRSTRPSTRRQCWFQNLLLPGLKSGSVSRAFWCVNACRCRFSIRHHRRFYRKEESKTKWPRWSMASCWFWYRIFFSTQSTRHGLLKLDFGAQDAVKVGGGFEMGLHTTSTSYLNQKLRRRYLNTVREGK